MLRTNKSKRRVSPEPDESLLADANNAIKFSTTQDLQETVTIQARAIREMTTSLERASSMMESQTKTFTDEIEMLKQKLKEAEAGVAEAARKHAKDVTPTDNILSTSDTPTSTRKESIADVVDAAAFMSELDEMIENLQKVGASKSLPPIVKHLLTLFRYVFPAQLVEFYVLDSYSDAYWSMSCLSKHNLDSNHNSIESSVIFSDASGETLTEGLLLKVKSAKSSVVIKDTKFNNGDIKSVKMNEIAEGSTTTSSISFSTTTTSNKENGFRRPKRQSFLSSTTKSNPVVTKFMSELSNPNIVDEWKNALKIKLINGITSGVIIPLIDTTEGGGFDQSFGEHNKANDDKVLAIFQIVNRLDPLEGNPINFSNKDLELLKLFLGRCNVVFRHTRTLTGLLSAARRRHGNISHASNILHGSNSSNSSLSDGRSLTAFNEDGCNGGGERKESKNYTIQRITLEQQLSQTKTWLKDQLLHREYKMIFQPNPSVNKKLNVFVSTIKALSKFLSTLARLRKSKRTSSELHRKNSIIMDLNTLNVLTLNFNEYDFTNQVLEEHAYNMMDMTGIIDKWHTPPDRLRLFIKRVSDSYLNNPYHCWQHGFMVMRMTCIMVNDSPYIKLNTYELGSICIAAMCHDIAHPGKNNAFETKINSALAIRYNDKSIYENMHAATTFEILSDPACDVYSTLTSEKRIQMRKMIIQSILMTDMASHFTLAKQLDAKVSGEGDHAITFDTASHSEDKQLFLDLIVSYLI